MLGAVLSLTVPAGAADTPTAGQPGRAGMMARMQQFLGLTDDQVSAIVALRQAQAPARKQVWQAMRDARSTLRTLALTGDDQAAIEAKTAEVQQLQAEMLALNVKMLQDMAPLLTQDQREKLASVKPWAHRRLPAPAAPSS
ncbi:MAG: periplasmic heavy metal sensor [Candidatus Rokubacteria bacterium]|nr:periplasmic heavy metal sensor [Candidatus Rokubacteria bacterium]